MSLSSPVNPPTLNEAVAKSSTASVQVGVDENQTKVNQLHGITFNNSSGAGIPKQVTNPQVSIANANQGSTCTVSVLFKVDPTDAAFSGINIWIKGYQGNSNPVLVGSGTASPTKIVINNTGETVTFILQAFGNGGNAPLNQSPTCSGTLPKAVLGGFGSSSVVASVSAGSSVTPTGSLSIAAPINVTVNPTAVNVSTEGVKDWFVLAGDVAIVPADSDTAVHWKLLGGWIRKSFAWWGPTGTITLSSNAASVFSITTNIGDDACLGQTRTTNFLSADQHASQLTANNGLAFSNWGFRIGALAGIASRTLKIYFLFSSGGVATDGQCQITARLEDGSVADVTRTLTPGVAGILFYTVAITFKASAEGVPLFVNFNVIQNTGDSGTRIGFQAATCF
jgi:hypothetical protein